MNRLSIILVTLGAIFIFTTPAQAVVKYSFTDLGIHPGCNTTNHTVPSAMNASGKVVGNSYKTGHDDFRAFLYSNGTMADLGLLPGYTYSGKAEGINDNGVVVGHCHSNSSYYNAPALGFVFENGAMTSLGTLGGTVSEAYAINNGGEIVGTSTIVNDSEQHAFLYSQEAMIDLGTLGGQDSKAFNINEVGQIVGYASTSANDIHAFLYNNGTMIDLGTLGGSDSYAWAINDMGQVVGKAHTGEYNASHAFLYSNGTMTDLGTFGGAFSSGEDINNHGQVVGYSHTLEGARAFLYEEGVITDLNNLINPALDITLSSAVAINDAGQIVAYGQYGSDLGNPIHAVLLTPVPEPSSLITLVLGIIGLLVYTWRRGIIGS